VSPDVCFPEAAFSEISPGPSPVPGASARISSGNQPGALITFGTGETHAARGSCYNPYAASSNLTTIRLPSAASAA
jgi:hypothetical protein